MEHEAWPSPQSSSREPLPRVEDLPVAEQGYEQESVKAAFDSFYRHAAQIDAALRTLEAVDSFHRQAAALRGDLRALRAAGWTQQSWTAPPTYGYGYGVRAPREGIPSAVWRIGGEVAFLVAVAVALGVAKLSWWAILVAMAGAFAIVCAIEWLAGRELQTFARPAEPAPVHPIVEAQRAEDTDEQESLGWAAFEEAQEPSDAMTIIGSAPAAEAAERPVRAERGPVEGVRGNREVPPTQTEVPEAEVPEAEVPEAEVPEAEVPEPEPEPDEPEPELPPAAEKEELPEARGHWWRRTKAEDGHEPEPELPRHVRVLPPDNEKPASDPWEQGFDAPVSAEADEFGEPDDETEDDVVEPVRRRFRRR